MVKHIIVFKLKDNSAEGRQKLKEVLSSMTGNVPSARKIEVRIDQLRSARSYDVYLSVDVDSWDQLEEYQKDAYHVGVVKKYVHGVVENSVAIDYEI
ncbi:MAG TPA: Dabb family protein [Clostridia bacterium]|nr:Dabb family protein [Clostridia bacterium]